LKDRHDHLLLKAKEDSEEKYKHEIEDLRRDKESIVNKLTLDLTDKLNRECENLNNNISNLKIEMDSKKYTHKEQLAEYDRMLQEEVEKRKRLNEELSQRNETIDKFTNESESLKNNLGKL